MAGECLVSGKKRDRVHKTGRLTYFCFWLFQQTQDNLWSRTTTMEHGKSRMKIDSEFSLST